MFDVASRVEQSEWLRSPKAGQLYVWLHVDDVGDPFYAGRGRGATAWERNGGIAWEYYVRECLGGCYHVVIPRAGLSEGESESWLWHYLEQHGPKLLNVTNPYRGMNSAAYQERGVLVDEERELRECVRGARSAVECIPLAHAGLDLQIRLQDLPLEVGRFGYVLRKMGADCSLSLDFIKPLVEALVETGKLDEARLALEKFHAHSVRHKDSKHVARLWKIIERGKLFRARSRGAP